MSETTNTTHPSFTAITNSYLEAYNAHSLHRVLAFLGPNIKVTFGGKPVLTNLTQISDAYNTAWADPNDGPVSIAKIEEVENGVKCALFDKGRGNIMKVNYWFEEVDGEWKHVWHEILSEVKKEEVQLSEK